MTLYGLRKKIQDDLTETEKTISLIDSTIQYNELHVAYGAKFITEKILEWVNEEIKERESRVSQLEKERARFQEIKEWVNENTAMSLINELRGVLGKENDKK